MNEQLKSLVNTCRSGCQKALPSNQSGQSLIILTFAFLGLIAMLGLALDAGLVYVSRVSLRRAVDAATLAGVVELPAEEEAMVRAMDFLRQNGYEDGNFYFAGCIRDVNDVFGNGADSLRNHPPAPIFIADLVADDGLAPVTEALSNDTSLYYLYATSGNPDAGTFFLDTRSYQIREYDEGGISTGADPQCNTDADLFAPVSAGGPFGSATKIRVRGQVPVRMNFMQFFGFDIVTLQDEAVAQNAANLDVAVVMDVTGSMQFDTICYGCWERCDEPDVTDCTANDRYLNYPTNGRAFPIDYNTVKDPYICGNGGDCDSVPYITPGDPKPITGTNYIILEAELYSNNISDWDPSFRSAGQGYWAMQRIGDSAISVDDRPAFVRHHPYIAFSDTGVEFGRNYSLDDAKTGAAPILQYDFIPTWADTDDTHIYIRVKAYDHNDSTQTPAPVNAVHWGIGAYADFPNPADVTSNADANNATRDRKSQDGDWEWIKLGSSNTLQNQKYTLSIYAGSPGYAIDRIIIAGGDEWDTVAEIEADIHEDSATPGTAQRVAADTCNPIYGLDVSATSCRPDGFVLPTTSVRNLNNPLFGDLQPIRGAKEAVKAFVNQLDPGLDQVGFVKFNPTAVQMAQLECLRAADARGDAGSDIAGYPLSSDVFDIEFDETVCDEDIEESIGFRNVLIGIEDTEPENGTDIADGLRRGLHMLGINTDDDDGQAHANDCDWQYTGSAWEIGGETQPDDPDDGDVVTSHCSRGAAATQVIVLLTDGAPTDDTPGDNDKCKENEIDPLPYPDFDDGDDKVRCIMYYAQIAGNNGIIVYTIGLGAGADPDLLGAVADETNGQYYFAPSAAQLNIIFNQILANIYVRLVQ